MSCSTSALHGYDGDVTGLTGVTEVKEWSIDESQEIADATSFASNGYREHVLGLKGATGSFTCVGDTAPSIGTNASVTFKTGSGTGDPNVTGDITITNSNWSVVVDDVVVWSADFTFCGEFTTTV